MPSGQGRSRQHDEGSTATPPDIDDGEAGGDALPLPPIVRRGRSIDAEIPACVGRVVHGPSGDQALIIRHRRSERALRPGDEIGGWRLPVIERGTARFRAPDGGEIAVASGAR